MCFSCVWMKQCTLWGDVLLMCINEAMHFMRWCVSHVYEWSNALYEVMCFSCVWMKQCTLWGDVFLMCINEAMHFMRWCVSHVYEWSNALYEVMCFSCTSMKQCTIISCSSLIEWMSVYVYTMLGVLVRVMTSAYEHINHEHIYVMWCTFFFQFSYWCCTTSFPFLNLFFFSLPLFSVLHLFFFSPGLMIAAAGTGFLDGITSKPLEMIKLRQQVLPAVQCTTALLGSSL